MNEIEEPVLLEAQPSRTRRVVLILLVLWLATAVALAIVAWNAYFKQKDTAQTLAEQIQLACDRGPPGEIDGLSPEETRVICNKSSRKTTPSFKKARSRSRKFRSRRSKNRRSKTLRIRIARLRIRKRRTLRLKTPRTRKARSKSRRSRTRRLKTLRSTTRIPTIRSTADPARSTARGQSRSRGRHHPGLSRFPAREPARRPANSRSQNGRRIRP